MSEEHVLKGGHVVPHHFESAEQAFESAKLGVWLFLVTEILLFGGLFVAYIVNRALYPEVFIAASKTLDVNMGAINTCVLLLSSFTMAMAVQYTKLNKLANASFMLVVTLICAGAFMGIKYKEYSHKFHEKTLPAKYYKEKVVPESASPSVAASAHTESNFRDLSNDEKLAYGKKNFFSLYFMMTGLHGFHVLVGMALILWLLVKTMKGTLSNEYYTPVEMVGIYWHLVDLIWIFLFPLLYLIG